MSRLQKKKPATAKKKRKDISKSHNGAEASSKFSGAKSAAVANPLKFKHEKSVLSDTVVNDPNVFQKGMTFLREVKVELKKVTWPTRKQTTGTTIVVIIFVFIVAAFLGLFDFGLSKLVQAVLT